MAETKFPTQLIFVLLVVFVLIALFSEWQGSLFTTYSVNNTTDLGALDNTRDVYDTMQEQYAKMEETMNKSSTGTNIFFEMPSIFLNMGSIIGFMFISIPTWFGAVIFDLANTVGIIPLGLLMLLLFRIMLDIVSWFIYFWTGREA